MTKQKTYKEDYKVTIAGVQYTVTFIIIRGREIFAYIYKGKECLHYWPKLKEGNQRTSDLLANEYVTKLSEKIIK